MVLANLSEFKLQKDKKKKKKKKKDSDEEEDDDSKNKNISFINHKETMIFHILI